MNHANSKIRIIALAAMDEGRVIGNKGGIPWHLPEDMKRIPKLTGGHTVMMGRSTYDSLPAKVRPLPNRVNVVVTRSPEKLSGEKGIEICTDPETYLRDVKAGKLNLVSDILWIFGGAELYKLSLPFWDELYLTLVHNIHSGDTYFPPFEGQFELVEEDKREGFTYLRYVRQEISPWSK